MTVIRETARAKVNLTLHVIGRRSDGFHQLESLVAFADLADDITLNPGQSLRLVIRGDDSSLPREPTENLIWRVARLFRETYPDAQSGTFELCKRIPVSAGLGGGSADAAAALRCLARANQTVLAKDFLARAAYEVGADIPVCFGARPALIMGIGDEVRPIEGFSPLAAVLLNPGVAVSTADVFAALNLEAGQDIQQDSVLPLLNQPDALIDYVLNSRNDLERAAIGLAPEISVGISALRDEPACQVARMSGSGATCFGLFSDQCSAIQAAEKIQARFKDWWVVAADLC